MYCLRDAPSPGANDKEGPAGNHADGCIFLPGVSVPFPLAASVQGEGRDGRDDAVTNNIKRWMFLGLSIQAFLFAGDM